MHEPQLRYMCVPEIYYKHVFTIAPAHAIAAAMIFVSITITISAFTRGSAHACTMATLYVCSISMIHACTL